MLCEDGYYRKGSSIGRGLLSSTFQLSLSRFDHTSPCTPV